MLFEKGDPYSGLTAAFVQEQVYGRSAHSGEKPYVLTTPFFILLLYFTRRKTLEQHRKFLWLLLLSIPLPYIAGQAGWIVTEVGRQPWVIQDYLPTIAAVSHIDSSAVQITFFLFAILFTGLLIAEVSIMKKQITKAAEE